MATSIWEHFSVLRAPRLERTKLHKLEDILTIALCAVLCGAETGVDIADFGRTKEAWLADVDDLSKRLAWYRRYVFGRSSRRLDPSALARFEDPGANADECQRDTLVAPSPPNGVDTTAGTKDRRTRLIPLAFIISPSTLRVRFIALPCPN